MTTKQDLLQLIEEIDAEIEENTKALKPPTLAGRIAKLIAHEIKTFKLSVILSCPIKSLINDGRRVCSNFFSSSVNSGFVASVFLIYNLNQRLSKFKKISNCLLSGYKLLIFYLEYIKKQYHQNHQTKHYNC